MKQLFKEINKVNKQIESTQSRIEEIKTMPYYAIFGNANERKKDLNTCNEYLNDCIDRKHALLESLMLECNKELGRVAMMEFELNKLKTA